MNVKDFSQPTILTGKQYGTTVSIELDHSDTSIDEVMDGFLTIVKGLGYLDSTVNEWIKDKSMDIYEDEHDIISKSLADDWFDESNDLDESDDTYTSNDFFGSYDDEMVDKPHYDWNEEETNERIDVIGQNGNDGTHYGLATDDDIQECELNEKQLKDYKGVYVERPTKDEDYEGQFKDWGNETPTDENEFDDYGMRIQKKMDKSKVRKGKIKDLKK